MAVYPIFKTASGVDGVFARQKTEARLPIPGINYTWPDCQCLARKGIDWGQVTLLVYDRDPARQTTPCFLIGNPYFKFGFVECLLQGPRIETDLADRDVIDLGRRDHGENIFTFP